MSDAVTRATPEGAHVPPRQRSWVVPTLRELPKLTQLTLASLIGGGGGTGGGGSTVFGLLFALLALAGCSAERGSGPGEAPTGPLSQTITCRATVATGDIDCGGPLATPQIIGKQGTLIALRSSNVSYNSGTEIFQFDVTVQNLSSTTLGYGTNLIDVFFQSGPSVTAGTGSATVLNEDGEDTYTAPGQPYFRWVDSLQSGETSDPKTWQLSMPATVTTFSFTVMVSAAVRDWNTGVLLWTAVPEFQTGNLLDIAVNSATDAMAVSYGDVLRKVGATWERLSPQITGTVIGVEPIGSGQYLAATTSGGIYRFNGSVWNKIEQAPSTASGFTAAAVDRFAVGNDSRVDWYGNTGWHSYTVAPGAEYNKLGLYASGQGVAINGDGSIVRFNFNSGTPSTQFNGLDLVALGASPTVGYMYGIADGTDAHIYDDAAAGYIYSSVPDTLVDALAYGPASTRWASVRSLTDDGSALNRWSGGVWSRQATLPTSVSQIVSDSAGGFYLLSWDGIRRWNGTSVVDELVANAGGVPVSVAATGDDVAIGTHLGKVRWFRSGTWTLYDANPVFDNAIIRVAVTGPDSAYALDGSGHLSGFNGVSWDTLANFAQQANDILAFAGDDLVLVGGSLGGGVVYRRVGGVWDLDDDPDAFTAGALNAVWGQSIDDYWAVGDSGKVVHFSGGIYTLNGPGTSQNLRAVTGSGSDVWVAGDSGYIAHWDGASWTSCTLGIGSIVALWSPSPGFVYAATDSGSVNAEAFLCGARAVKVPGGFGQVQEMAGDDPSRVWALKGGVVYRGRR